VRRLGCPHDSYEDILIYPRFAFPLAKSAHLIQRLVATGRDALDRSIKREVRFTFGLSNKLRATEPMFITA
jgi:hypothetical protein